MKGGRALPNALTNQQFVFHADFEASDVLSLFDIRGEEAIPIQENSISSDCSEGKVAGEEGRRDGLSRRPSSVVPWAQ